MLMPKENHVHHRRTPSAYPVTLTHRLLLGRFPMSFACLSLHKLLPLLLSSPNVCVRSLLCGQQWPLNSPEEFLHTVLFLFPPLWDNFAVTAECGLCWQSGQWLCTSRFLPATLSLAPTTVFHNEDSAIDARALLHGIKAKVLEFPRQITNSACFN